ncbi:MAG: tRNA dihydrouridine(20/20a) synthase DusA [Alphaproteobacteria bacterium]
MNQDLNIIQQKEVSVAPMMDWTDRHCRYFHRLLSPHARLYTEMVTTGALLHGDWERHLRFDPAEQPLALQLGGSDAAALAACAKAGEESGYNEINLNCGCPSDRVQEGRFGACLMKEPAHVADCIEAMIKSVNIPVTVKCRIGIDNQDDFAFLDEFIKRIADTGCGTFIIHARKAWLEGLSPKENREKPLLHYERAAAIKDKYPHLRIILNGGIAELSQVHEQLKIFDGVMIGREAYQNPWFLMEIENEFFPSPDLALARSPSPAGRGKNAEGIRGEGFTREQVVLKMMQYAKQQNELYGTPVKSITRHILGLYHGRPRGKVWRRVLSTLPHKDGADESVILRALEVVSPSKIEA